VIATIAAMAAVGTLPVRSNLINHCHVRFGLREFFEELPERLGDLLIAT
jgi:hypothetical protein